MYTLLSKCSDLKSQSKKVRQWKGNSPFSTPTPCISYVVQQGGKPIRWQRRGEPLPASSLYHVGQGLASASPWGLSDAHSQFALSQKRLPRGLPSEWKGMERLRSTLWVMTKWRHFQGSRRNWQSLGYTNLKNSKLTGSCLECTRAQLCTAHACAGPCARVEAQRPCQMSSLMAFHVYYWSRAPWWNQSSPVPAKPADGLPWGLLPLLPMCCDHRTPP